MDVARLLNALLDWLRELFPSAATAVAVQKIQEGAAAKHELEAVDAGAKAAARVDAMSDDDVVRDLKKRGLYRVLGEPSSGEQ